MLCNGGRVHKLRPIMSIPVSMALRSTAYEWIMRLRRRGEWNAVESGGKDAVHSFAEYSE